MKKTVLISVFIILSFFGFSQGGAAGCWRDVSAGQNFTLAIKTDGTLWGWGQNGNQLGLGYFSATENLPIQIGTANDWMAVSAGANHALAVKTNGTLWSWGNGTFGQLGTGAFNVATWTVTQVGTATDWLDVSAGTQFSLALKNTGTIWSWGQNNVGQLGNGNFVDTNTPNQVGLASNWQSIDAGHQHSLAINALGDLYSWGDNTFGQLGSGNFTSVNVPTQIATGTVWIGVSAGFDHSMILDNNFLLYTFGDNSTGELGDGTNTTSNTPVNISFSTSGTVSNYIAISAGQGHSLVIKNDNTLWSTGNNNQGQLGLGNLTNTNTLNQVGTNNNWGIISAGFVHSQAMDTSTDLWSAGRGLEGQMGVGTNTNSTVLVMVNCPASLQTNEYQANSQGFLIHPNPTTGMASITYNLNQPETVTMRITSVQGQLISETTSVKSNAVSSDYIDLSKQASGLYFVTFITEKGSQTLKICKE